ncbi:TetR/AcrR family transcriptional regulator [Cryobacterium adonitolivorans]|uniref:TetR/AcrR family transcriptional regulator n=1 Tax=Cryobacterium adonitolivorans TaxID=1259189 RepID=A0A4R8W3G6_9MICO|nr:TetR/AcrR family transcriptional regulator [Cryobacterium adonitolivorans]TFB99540.1 TetR/AcrR family transcriptional regulator [Cryobacterium adonitolivorans]
MTPDDMAARPQRGHARERGRPRHPDIDAAIVAAALELLAEVGYAGFTIAGVARRAGVSKPTVYRRWAQKSQLVVEAMATQMPRETGVRIGSVAEQLLDYATRLSVTLTHTPLGRVLPGLVAAMETDPQLATSYRTLIIEPTRRLWRDAVERGMAAGELLPDTDVEFVLDALAGPLYVRVLITGAPADPDAPRLAVQLVLARYGMAPASGVPRHPYRTANAGATP